MRLFYYLLIPVITSSLLVTSCTEALDSQETLTENQIDWQGVLDSAPENPKDNWVYFDLGENVTFIYSDTGWDTMTISGIDGINIKWLGALDAYPTEFGQNSAFFHKGDSVTYIYSDTAWDILTMSGEDGISIDWRGSLTEEPGDPAFNTGYHNLLSGISYLWNGSSWEIISVDGLKGKDLVWLGTHDTIPLDVAVNSAYYNSSAKMSYIFDGTSWQIICRDGEEGEEGESLVWMGSFSEHPLTAENLYAYYNTTDRITYIYDGIVWNILATSGKNGKDFIWIGEFPAHPNPDSSIVNTGYFNTTDSSSYIFDGTNWNTLCIGGKDGINGTNGHDGLSIEWLGSYYNAPSVKKTNTAYYNLSDSTSYIYDGSDWRILAKSGKDGIIINWRGSSSYQPYNPQEYDAYFNSADRNSYIYIQGTWQLLSQGGQDGVDGLSINWLGNYTSAPSGASQNDVYYNTSEGVTYIYNNGTWEIFSKDGKDGKDAEIETSFIKGYIESGDSLILIHNMNSYDLYYDAQYITEGNLINSVSYIDPSWVNPYVTTLNKTLYTEQSTIRKLKRLDDNSIIHIYANTESMFKGGWFGLVSDSGDLGDLIRFSDKTEISPIFDMVELNDGTKVFSYIDLEKRNKGVVSFVSVNDDVTLMSVEDSLVFDQVMCKSSESEVAVFTLVTQSSIYLSRISSDSIESKELAIDVGPDDAISSMSAELLENGAIVLAYTTSEGVIVSIIETDGSVSSTEIVKAGYTGDVKDMVVLNDNVYLYSQASSEALLSKLTSSGTLDSDTVLQYTLDVRMDVLNDSQLVLLVDKNSYTYAINGNYYSIPAAKKVEVMNEDFSVYSSNNISENIRSFEFVVRDDQSLSMTHTANSYEFGDLEYSKLEVSALQPCIKLKALSQNSACLINETGRSLEMRLAVIKSRSANSNALRAER